MWPLARAWNICLYLYSIAAEQHQCVTLRSACAAVQCSLTEHSDSLATFFNTARLGLSALLLQTFEDRDDKACFSSKRQRGNNILYPWPSASRAPKWTVASRISCHTKWAQTPQRSQIGTRIGNGNYICTVTAQFQLKVTPNSLTLWCSIS